MTGQQSEKADALILRHQDGSYYAIPRSVVEEYRVPEARIAELETMLSEAQLAELDEEVYGIEATNYAMRESEIVFEGWHVWDPNPTG